MTSIGSLESILKTYSSKLENLDEMGNFLDVYNQPKLKQEDINQLNRPTAINEIETVKKSLLTKNPGPEEFMAEIYQPFKRSNTNTFQTFQGKKKDNEQYQTHSMKPALISLQKPIKMQPQKRIIGQYS
jgi:hypothetical protein